MSRWKVVKISGWWYAISPGAGAYLAFSNRVKALTYADRKARTVAVELPRLDCSGHKKIGGIGLYSLQVDHQRPNAVDIQLGGWGDLIIENQHLEPLALYLLALARHREGTNV